MATREAGATRPRNRALFCVEAMNIRDGSPDAIGAARPIVLIGATRSGTKILRDLIAQHRDIDRVPYDINYIWKKGSESLGHDQIPPESATTETVSFIRAKIAAFGSGRPLIIEKTVANCLRIPYVRNVLPDAVFLHLIRDGGDAVESIRRQWEARPDWRYISKKALTFPLRSAFGYGLDYALKTVRRMTRAERDVPPIWGVEYPGIREDIQRKELIEVCAIQWVRCVETALADLASLPDDLQLTVRYETLVEEPAHELRRVERFLGVAPDVSSCPSALTSVTSANVGKGRTSLQAEGKAKVAPIMDRTLVSLGYAPLL